MKTLRYIAAIALLCVAAVISAEEKEVTTFLGIPVDGSKKEMIKKLVKKGYIHFSKGGAECLFGEFNNTKVEVFVMTNKDKVNYIGIRNEDGLTASQAIRSYNKLIYDFRQTGRYLELTENHYIPDDENILHEITVNDKSYYAHFYQKLNNVDLNDYTLNTDTTNSIMKYMDDYKSGRIDSLTFVKRVDEEKEKAQKILDNIKSSLLKIAMKHVFFMIAEDKGKFYMQIYYQNEYNSPNGEDL